MFATAYAARSLDLMVLRNYIHQSKEILGTEQLTSQAKAILPSYLDVPDTLKKKFSNLIDNQ